MKILLINIELFDSIVLILSTRLNLLTRNRFVIQRSFERTFNKPVSINVLRLITGLQGGIIWATYSWSTCTTGKGDGTQAAQGPEAPEIASTLATIVTPTIQQSPCLPDLQPDAGPHWVNTLRVNLRLLEYLAPATDSYNGAIGMDFNIHHCIS